MFSNGMSPPGLSQEAKSVVGHGNGEGMNGKGGGVVKSRTKVSRACDSCRKKKIKCSGTLPCKSCQTYGCECVYSYVAGSVSKRKKTKKSDAAGGNEVVDRTSVSILNPSSVALKMETAKRFEAVSRNPAAVAATATTTSSVSRDGVAHPHGHPQGLSSATPCKVDIPTVVRATEPLAGAGARARAGSGSVASEGVAGQLPPYVSPSAVAGTCSPPVPGPGQVSGQGSSHASINGSGSGNGSGNGNGNPEASSPQKKEPHILYRSLSDVEDRIEDLKKCIQDLKKSSQPQSESIVYAIKNIEFEIATLKKKISEPRIKREELSNPALAEDNAICLEAKLLRNYESTQVNLNRYVKVDTNRLEGYLYKPPLIDITYGMHYPGQWLSLRGIGHFAKEFLRDGLFPTKESKENLYLLLRHFDINSAIEKENAQCWSAPIETYCARASINVPEGERIRFLLNKIPTRLLHKLVNTKKQFRIENWYDIVSNVGNNTVSYTMETFHWVVAILETNRIEYQKLCRHFKLAAQQKDGKNISRETTSFIEAEELLFSLALHFFKRISISRSDAEPLAFIDDVLDFVMNLYWIDGHQTFTYLLTQVVQVLKVYGLDQWETYLVMDERMADSRRMLWWKTFFWDQYSIFITGSKPLFHGPDSQSPLFPKFMRQMNCVDYQDLLKKIDEEVDVGTVDFTNKADISLRDVLGFVIFLSCFFSRQFQMNIIYNDRFANFRIFAQNHAERVRMAEELLRELRIYKRRLDILNAALQRYVLSGNVKADPNEDPDLKDPGLYWYYITMEAFFTFCVVSATHILARLNLGPDNAEMNHEMKTFRKSISLSWKTVISYLEMNDDIYDLFFMSKLILLIAVSYVGENLLYFKLSTLDDVFSFLKLCRYFEYCGVSCDSIDQTRIQRSLLQVQFFVKILVRVVIDLYLDYMKKDFNALLAEVASSEHPEYQDTILKLFDNTFSYFSPSLSSIKESELHVQVKTWLSEALFNKSDSMPSSLFFFDDLFPTNLPSESTTTTDHAETPNTILEQTLGKVPPTATQPSLNVNSSQIPNQFGVQGKDGVSMYGQDKRPINMQHQQQQQQQHQPQPQPQPQQQQQPQPQPQPQSHPQQHQQPQHQPSVPVGGKTDTFHQFNPDMTQSPQKSVDPQGKNDQGTFFNLGTIQDFADHGNVDQLFSFLWDDLVTGPAPPPQK